MPQTSGRFGRGKAVFEIARQPVQNLSALPCDATLFLPCHLS